ncbi:MAG TPA: hypothetical protein VHR97_03425 [Candidatus Baltobacteraceae bacterium]|jgi:hypothetical protein|nr:hypothetical protein [Candidatus Baltobacteraceae bacterium]
MDSNSCAAAETFVVDHPAFGNITFVFDGLDVSSGFAASEGFVYLSVQYPKFDFSFQREGATFSPSPLNNATRHLIDGRWQTVSEIAPPAFRYFALSKAKELANRHSSTDSR